MAAIAAMGHNAMNQQLNNYARRFTRKLKRAELDQLRVYAPELRELYHEIEVLRDQLPVARRNETSQRMVPIMDKIRIYEERIGVLEEELAHNGGIRRKSRKNRKIRKTRKNLRRRA
jgi:hypothetical protein